MDKALKQRLVGASVLVALAVVVLPMLLSGQPDSQGESRRIDLPPKPQELSFETRRFPIGDQPSDQPSVLEKPDPTPRQPQPVQPENLPQAEEPEPSPVESPPVDVETGSEQVVDGPPPPVVLDPAVADSEGRYLAQVASFSSVANANRLAGRLRDAGMPVLMDTVEATAGLLHRVRIGPYAERGDADRAIAALNQQFPDLNPRVLDLRPQETAQVSAPSDPLIRWVVQVGVFSSASNTEILVQELRDAGYTASSVAVSNTSGTLYKVLVGPVVDHEDALDLKNSLQNDMGLDGLVMSAD